MCIAFVFPLDRFPLTWVSFQFLLQNSRVQGIHSGCYFLVVKVSSPHNYNLWGKQSRGWFNQKPGHSYPGTDIRLNAHLELSPGCHTWTFCLLWQTVCVCMCIMVSQHREIHVLFSSHSLAQHPAKSQEHSCYFQLDLGWKLWADNREAPGVPAAGSSLKSCDWQIAQKAGAALLVGSPRCDCCLTARALVLDASGPGCLRNVPYN